MNKNNKPAGRPAGSQNATYTEAVEIPAACGKCHSVNLTTVRGSRPLKRDIAGELPNGFRYRAIIWIRKVCECKQRVNVKVYIPKKENA